MLFKLWRCVGLGVTSDFNRAYIERNCIPWLHPILAYDDVFNDRSHDNYVTRKDGSLEPVRGSKYASQQTVFDDLGKGVLHNAFEG